MQFNVIKTEHVNSITIDWVRLSISINLFPAFAAWLNIPTAPEDWGEMKRFNKVFGVYLMDGVAVYADGVPTVDDGGHVQLDWDGRGEKRFVVDFSGSGLANWFTETGDTPLDILRYAREIHNELGLGDVRVNRLDVAFDDHNKYLNVDKIERYLKKENLVVTRWEKYQRTGECEIRKQSEEEPEDTGDTIYLGSRLSNSFARIYDKLKELKSKMNREERRAAAAEGAFPEHWVRFELELKREHAQAVANGLLNADDPAEFALGVLRGKIDFKATTGDARIRRRGPVRWWERFTTACAAVPIRVPRPILTLERIQNWVDHSVAPSLAVLYLAVGGGETGSVEIERIAREGMKRLDEKKLGILRGLASPAHGMAHGC